MAFKKGNKEASGGKRAGAGRPSTSLREYAKDLKDKYQLLERMAYIANGGLIPITIKEAGQAFDLPAPPETQIKAAMYVIDRAEGKPKQEIQHGGEVGSRLFFVRADGTETDAQ